MGGASPAPIEDGRSWLANLDGASVESWFERRNRFWGSVNDLQKDLEMNLTGGSQLCVGRTVSDRRFLPLQGLVCLILLARMGFLARLRAAVEKVLLSGLGFSFRFSLFICTT